MSDAPPKKVIGRPFAPGNPGRPVGSRNKLGTAFLDAMFDDFNAHGVDAIAKARLADPSSYVRVIAGLLPKELSGVDGEPLLAGIKVEFVRPATRG